MARPEKSWWQRIFGCCSDDEAQVRPIDLRNQEVQRGRPRQEETKSAAAQVEESDIKSAANAAPE